MTQHKDDLSPPAAAPFEPGTGPGGGLGAGLGTGLGTGLGAAQAEAGRGSFAELLHDAVEASGLTLYAIQQRLALSGVNVSVTTLSYWRRGRSRPERAASLRAVPLLEELLGLPDHALSGRLGSPRPRGRWAVKQPLTEARRLDELWPDDPWLLDVLEELEAPPAESLERLSIHDDYHVDARSGQYLLRVRQVVRATTDRVSRCIVGFKSNEAMDDPAVFNLVRHARVGRIRHRPDSAFVLAELVLDTPLNTGDTAVFDYEVLMSNAEPATNCDRRFTTPAREYVLQVHFDPAAVPAHCYHYERDCGDPRDRLRTPLWIGSSGTAHVVALDAQPGVVGIRWEWT